MLDHCPEVFYAMYNDQSLESLIIRSMYHDSIYIFNLMRSALLRGAATNHLLRRKQYQFGYNLVTLGTQIHRSQQFLPTLLKILIFGPQFCNLNKSKEVIYKTANRIVIHIASQERIDNLFSIGTPSLRPLRLEHEGKFYRACGKLIIKYDGRRRTRGEAGGAIHAYILKDYIRNKLWRWTILVADGTVLEMDAPTYSNHTWIFKDFYYHATRRFVVVSYNPARIVIHKKNL